MTVFNNLFHPNAHLLPSFPLATEGLALSPRPTTRLQEGGGLPDLVLLLEDMGAYFPPGVNFRFLFSKMGALRGPRKRKSLEMKALPRVPGSTQEQREPTWETAGPSGLLTGLSPGKSSRLPPPQSHALYTGHKDLWDQSVAEYMA